MLAAGTLNQLVTIQTLCGGQDAIGQVNDDWRAVATVWASVLHTSGAEAIRAGHDTSVVAASIRIRWRTDVTAGMRVLVPNAVGSDIYEIKAVLPDLIRREKLDLVCERIG